MDPPTGDRVTQRFARRRLSRRRALTRGATGLAAAGVALAGLGAPAALRAAGTTVHAPADLRYTPTHEWVKVVGDGATVGLTDHAQAALGELVYLALPASGLALQQGQPCGTVESLKATVELAAPVAGVVTAHNEAAVADPALVNRSPYERGWLITLQLSQQGRAQLAGLLTAQQYKALLATTAP